MSIWIYKVLLALVAVSAFFARVEAQVANPQTIQAMIKRYKADPRGPYLDIKWFCQDGSIREARDPCPDKPGNQRARYKDEVNTLAKKEHIFLGQILTTTPHADFWDNEHGQSRLKQYQLEQYLRGIDNGWINRRAQYYRGATQDEDENSWGIDFYQWLLADAARVDRHYFIIRQSAKDIPHAADNNNIQLVRALSKEISDIVPSFQDLRIKIHGKPDEGDILHVRDFLRDNRDKMPKSVHPKFEQLFRELAIMYRPFQVGDFDDYLRRLPVESDAAAILVFFINWYPTLLTPAERCHQISQTGLQLRQQINKPMKSTARLSLIDISNKLESLFYNEVSQWNPSSLHELISQVYCLSEAATAFGLLELWEWEQIKESMSIKPFQKSITLQMMSDYSQMGLRVAEWGSGMIRAHYLPVIELYRDFEPLATGFYDDRVRSSVLLPLGFAVSRLGDAFSREAHFSNAVLAISGQSSIRGLNPGYAVGELVVVQPSAKKILYSPHKIYVFQTPPDDLKPVGGIVSVTEGNMVSHVQLLARNLGIPNAVISRENMESLKTFHGLQVFYAVSNNGTVIMKPAFTMAPWEFDLFKQQKERDQKVSVPINQIELDKPSILNLNQVKAHHSGKICGPKAANLGQLKQMFPENVVEGLVLPFALFRQHMDQRIPGEQISYWTRMKRIFERGESLRHKGIPVSDVEASILKGLDSLRGLIRTMPLLPAFRDELRQQFQTVFRQPMGKVPVFIRSDTNMEDLKDFTGAGLNLTVFNVLDPDRIFQGIRDVWASPYTERSFKWRQRFLNNPENVFPSILIIPSIDADHSGVLITKGLATGSEKDITIAFNRGVGGAVDGQAAETWLLRADGAAILLTPAREKMFLTIPATGGSVRKQATFEKRILSQDNLAALRMLAAKTLLEFPAVQGSDSKGPYDMELGFKDNKIWLFQVRPFVENTQATASAYLQFITPKIDGKRNVRLDQKI